MRIAQIRKKQIRLIRELESWADMPPWEGLQDITGINPVPEVGWIWNGTAFEPSEPLYFLSADVDKNVIAADGVEEVTFSVQIKEGYTLTSKFDGMVFYIPVFDVDGKKKHIIKGDFFGGEFQRSFSTDDPGFYDIRLSRLRRGNGDGLPNNFVVVSQPIVIAE